MQDRERDILGVNKKVAIFAVVIVVVALIFVTLNTNNQTPVLENNELIHQYKYGIYALDLETQQTELIYSSAYKMSKIRLNNAGDKLVFAKSFANTTNESVSVSTVNPDQEICTINVDGTDYQQITNDNNWDLIPCWTNDDSKIVYLSKRETLDIFIMDADGSNPVCVYDSGGHDSDMHYCNGKIVFTRDSQIWIINEDGTGLTQVTDPPRADEWGNAVLPFGDYDPFWSFDGTKIVFERMVDDETSHGIYEIYVVNADGTGETALTSTRYTQGIASWSHSDEKIVYMVSAIGNQGYYDLYMMNAEGSDQHSIIPDYYPVEFLCHHPIFSADDSKVFFIGEWYTD